MATPVLAPVTTPPATVATDGLELLHVPPGVALLSVTVEPMQVNDGPVMGVMPAVTDIVPVTVHVDEPNE